MLSNVTDCKVVNSEMNMSDHRPVVMYFVDDLTQVNGTARIGIFHRFPWYDQAFCTGYQSTLDTKMRELLSFGLAANLNDEFLDGFLVRMQKTLVECARMTEKSLGLPKKRAKANRRALVSDRCLQGEYSEVRRAHNIWKETNDLNDFFKWKECKRRFRKQQNEYVKQIKRERCNRIDNLYRMRRDDFWKFVRRERKTDSTVDLKEIDFEAFYRKLYASEPLSNDFQVKINECVQTRVNELRGVRLESAVTLLEVKAAMGGLSLGKSVGYDGVCAEMYRYGVDTALANVITWYFSELFSIGYMPKDFNVSLITPIPKTSNQSTDPADFRPISVSSSLSLIFEGVIRQRMCMSGHFRVNENQFGFSAATSTKHAYFVVNETLQFYRNGGGHCWAAALDATKAFDRLWRTGLFYKLLDKLTDAEWRILYLYYKASEGMVRLNNERSRRFVIEEGVKQGGIISPFLFNIFIDDLLSECVKSGLGASVGSVTTCIIGYCDDLILLSPLKSHLRKLLSICERYAGGWKIKFNPLKSTIYCTKKKLLSSGDFSLCGGMLRKVENFEYLGLPIGDRKYVDEFYNSKFKSVERALFAIRRIGLHNNYINPECLGFIYKQYCQSIFLYGLEVVHLSKGLLRQIQSRQGAALKLALNLSRYSRTSPLLEAIHVSPILELYFKFKYLFLGQVKKNCVAFSVYKEIKKRNKIRGSKESYLNQISELESIVLTDQDNKNGDDLLNLDKNEVLARIRNKFSCGNQGLVDSVRVALGNPEARDLLRLLLWVNFDRDSDGLGSVNSEDRVLLAVEPE